MAETLVTAMEAQLEGARVLRMSAPTLDVEGLLARLNEPSSGTPVVAILTDAERLPAGDLRRLHAALDAEAVARGSARLILVGGEALRHVIAHTNLVEFRAAMCLDLNVPPAPDTPAIAGPERDASGASGPGGGRVIPRRWAAGLVGLGLVAAAVAVWVGSGSGPRSAAVAPVAADVPEALPLEAPVPTIVEMVAAPEPADVEAAVERAPAAVEPEPVAPVDPEPAAVEPEPTPVAPPPASEPTVVALAAPRPGLSLQVGSFANVENAERLAARLRPRFDGVEVSTTQRAGRTLHRVRVTGFASENDRLAAARRLAADGVESVPVR